MISSTSNAQVKAVAALVKKAKARREQDLFVVEGIRMFREIPAGRLHKAYVSESFLSQPGNGRDSSVSTSANGFSPDSAFPAVSMGSWQRSLTR